MTLSRENNVARDSYSASQWGWVRGVMTVALGLMLVPATQLRAQSKNQQIAQKMSQNQQMLRAYSWTKRTEVLVSGEPVTRLVKVRYDIDGKLQRTTVGGSGDLTPEMRGMVADLEDRGFAYTQPDPRPLLFSCSDPRSGKDAIPRPFESRARTSFSRETPWN